MVPPSGQAANPALVSIGFSGRAFFLFLSLVFFVVPIALFYSMFARELGGYGDPEIEMYVEKFGPWARIVFGLLALGLTGAFWKWALGMFLFAFQNEAPLLHRLVEAADTPAVQAQLTAGANRNARDRYGNTALHIAAFKGHLLLVSALLDAGFDKDAKDKDGETALHKAASQNHGDIVSALLAAGADKGAQDKHGRSALHLAAFDSGVESISVLLSAGLNKDAAIAENGLTPLHLAAAQNRSRAVTLLLAAGANKEIKDNQGRTAIEIARSRGHTAIFKMLEAGMA